MVGDILDQEKLLLDIGMSEIPCHDNFPPLGKCFILEDEKAVLRYWLYEKDEFIINIHDFYIHDDYIFNFQFDESIGDHVSISLIKEATGELLSMNIKIQNGSILAHFHKNSSYRGVLHGGYPFLSVGFEYKDGFINKYFPKKYGISFEDIKKAISNLNSRKIYPKLIKISDDILNYRENSPMSEFFYETKANEFLSTILEEYYSKKEIKKDDKKALEDVTKYIDEHYMIDISLDFLSKISLMSKSKLKNIFKDYYGVTITEYTQRRRIHIADHLLKNTDLNISNIAKSVGYSSHSRFSKIYKRYKNISPSEFQNIQNKD